MNQLLPDKLSDEASDIYAHLFQALSERSRLAVLQHLSLGEHKVRDLVAHLGLAQSTVSRHLAFLLECGLVRVRPDGRSSWYSIAEPAELAGLFDAAGALLRSVGDDAVLKGHLHSHSTSTAPGGAL